MIKRMEREERKERKNESYFNSLETKENKTEMSFSCNKMLKMQQNWQRFLKNSI